MVVHPAKEPELALAARRLFTNKIRYQAIEAKTTVPWFVIALIDEMEAGGGCRKHLHNGDPLSARTVQVPRGRPPTPAVPPFSWEESAIDALTYDGLDLVASSVGWSIERLCYQLEGYNGWGYRMKGVPDPYLWSYSDQYSCGRYVSDGVYSASAVSNQPGAMPILRALMAEDLTITFGPVSTTLPTPRVEPTTPVHPKPLPRPVPPIVVRPKPVPVPPPAAPAPPAWVQAILRFIASLFGR